MSEALLDPGDHVLEQELLRAGRDVHMSQGTQVRILASLGIAAGGAFTWKIHLLQRDRQRQRGDEQRIPDQDRRWRDRCSLDPATHEEDVQAQRHHQYCENRQRIDLRPTCDDFWCNKREVQQQQTADETNTVCDDAPCACRAR